MSLGVQEDRPTVAARVCAYCDAWPCVCPRERSTRRVRSCACGGRIVAEYQTQRVIQAAVWDHNKTLMHQMWRCWMGL